MNSYSGIPDSITLPGGTMLLPCLGTKDKHLSVREIIAAAKSQKRKYRKISVLSGNLRGKRDLHGSAYKPTVHVMVERKPEDEIYSYV